MFLLTETGGTPPDPLPLGGERFAHLQLKEKNLPLTLNGKKEERKPISEGKKGEENPDLPLKGGTFCHERNV